MESIIINISNKNKDKYISLVTSTQILFRMIGGRRVQHQNHSPNLSIQTGITDRPITSPLFLSGTPTLSLSLTHFALCSLFISSFPLQLLPKFGLTFNYGLIISFLIKMAVKATHFLTLLLLFPELKSI